MTTVLSTSQESSARTHWLPGAGVQGLVSYIVPAYNVAPYILDTLESCRLQNYRPLQIVVVNDGSTDATEAIVGEFHDRFNSSEFQVNLISQDNAGLNTARNSGLRAATGRVVGFLDADDMLPATRTTHLCYHLETRNADLIYGPCTRFRERCEVEAYLSSAKSDQTADVISESPPRPVGKWTPNIWSFLARREFLSRVGPLSEHLRPCWSDLDYTVRIRHQGPRMYSTSRVVNLYRKVSGSNADRSRPEAIRGAIRAVEEIDGFFQKVGEIDADSLQWLGARYWTTARWALRANMRDEAILALQGSWKNGTGVTRYLSLLVLTACHIPAGCRTIASGATVMSRLNAMASRRHGEQGRSE